MDPFIYVGVHVIAFAFLVCNWIIGDQQPTTKLVLTATYLASWALLIIGFWAVALAQVIFAIVVGTMTFGIEWMMRR